MKFIVDAQLSVRIARLLQASGYDTIHTLDLPFQNKTPDTEINSISIQQSRIVVTKDRDFFDSFIIHQEPYKLLLVTTGNIKNTELLTLLINNLPQLVELFEQHSLIELNRDTITIHQ